MIRCIASSRHLPFDQIFDAFGQAIGNYGPLPEFIDHIGRRYIYTVDGRIVKLRVVLILQYDPDTALGTYEINKIISIVEIDRKFSEVKSCFLLSGTYDLLLIVEGKDINTVANFVSEKLAPLSSVKGTTTHFMLKKYKEDGVVMIKTDKNKRLNITY